MAVTLDDVRAFALTLPEATESSHHGTPDFRVRKKIFATLHLEDGRAVAKLSKDQQALWAEMMPDVFKLESWSQHGWTQLEIDKMDQPLLEDVLTHAWKQVAPKKLIKEFEGES